MTAVRASRWVNDHEAMFNIDDKEYQVSFTSMEHLGAISDFKREWSMHDYHVDFCLWNDDGYCDTMVTGTGDAFAVFSTVIKIIKEFCNKNSWKSLYFTASEPNRQGLYATLMKRFLRDGYPNKREGKYFIIENPKFIDSTKRGSPLRRRSPAQDKWEAPGF